MLRGSRWVPDTRNRLGCDKRSKVERYFVNRQRPAAMHWPAASKSFQLKLYAASMCH